MMEDDIEKRQIPTGVLYISYDGLTDQLGQSQIIPYLNKLAEKGFEISLISCEKRNKFADIEEVKKTLHQKIQWHFVFYTKFPPVFSTIYDIYKIWKLANRIIQKKPSIRIVHCRSYISAMTGIRLKRKYHLKFIFDMRGFYADERIDGEIWSKNHFLYNRIYQYFKKQELLFLNESDYTISLTEAGKTEILKWQVKPDLHIEVIPCCADQDFFSPEQVQNEQLRTYRKTLGINDSDFIISYLGGMGTWYLPMEMLSFFKQLLRSKPEARFLIITTDKPSDILQKAEKLEIPSSKLIIKAAKRQEVPIMLSLSNISIFFIKAVYSKKASCPTKLGETLCMGIPVICNSGVGDVDQIIKETRTGILVDDFTEKAYEKAINEIDSLIVKSKNSIREAAIPYFSLDEGAEKYAKIYFELSAQI